MTYCYKEDNPIIIFVTGGENGKTENRKPESISKNRSRAAAISGLASLVGRLV